MCFYRMDSCPCKACLRQMALQSQPPGEENSWRRNRLRNELKSKLSVLSNVYGRSPAYLEVNE